MAARSHQRGWPIIYIDGRWVYDDTGESIDVKRPCLRCGQIPTTDGCDACLGMILGLTSACCGHGAEPPSFVPPLRCWHCNGEVQMLEDGWLCLNCGQHGPPFGKPASTFEEGCSKNHPYARQT